MNITYIIQNSMRFNIPLLLFAAILLFHIPRRKYFIPRLIISLIGYGVLVYFSNDIMRQKWLVIGWLRLYFLLYVVAIVAAIYFCFKIKFRFTVFFAVSSYLLQHTFDRIFNLYKQIRPYRMENRDAIDWVVYSIILVLLLIFAYVFFGRRTKKEKFTVIYEKAYNYIFYVLMLISFGVVYVLSCYMMFGKWEDSITSKIYGMILCVLLLFNQFGLFDIDILRRDKKTLERVIENNQKHQIEMQENMNYINMKMHDFKHIFNNLDEATRDKKYMEEFKELISNYENTLTFKNKAIRSLIMEKTLQCKKENINFTFMIDEEKLEFFKDPDLISILGNALNNALEAVRKLDDDKEKYIKLIISTRGNMLQIHVENSFSGTLEVLGENVISSKKDDILNHGFGLKSIFYITEKYHGIHSFKAEKQIFTLNLLFAIE